MRCVFNSPRPSQRTWPKRKAFPNEIASVSFLALTFPTSSSRTSDGTRNLFSPPLRIAVNTSRAQRGRRPQRGGVSRPLLRHPKAPQLPGQGRSLQPPASRAGQILGPCPGPSMEMRTPPHLPPAARHTTRTHKTPDTQLRPRRCARQLAPDPRGEREARARWGNRVGPRGTGASAAPPRSLTHSMK